MQRHDVVIIGGGLAGSSCALELRLKGIDAVAFERDRFPRDKVCGAFLSPSALQYLEELGLIDDVKNAGAMPMSCARVRGFGSDFTIPFERMAMGLSRRRLDALVAKCAGVHEGIAVRSVEDHGSCFIVGLPDGNDVSSRIVVDAAGKLSRFTARVAVEEFGIQCEDEESPVDRLDFWFFDDGYGGTCPVEGNRTNSCYLVKKSALRHWLDKRPDWLVTGRLAYERPPGAYISAGDAAGMMDPFCGDGMAHALASGLMAGRVIAHGLDRGWDYQRIRRTYDDQLTRQWRRKRMLSKVLRRAIQKRQIAPYLFRLAQSAPILPTAFLRRVWAA